MRAWVLGQCRKQDTVPQISQVFHSLGAPEGTRQLDRFMQALAYGARRNLAVHCVCNPQVSADEACLLAVLRLQQQERHEEAFDMLATLTVEFATIAGCDSANRLVIALAESGQFFSSAELRASLWRCTAVDAGLHRLH
ncbi:hypothetical protein Acid7E03_07710 [Acidisoma sp. 7E03]